MLEEEREFSSPELPQSSLDLPWRKIGRGVSPYMRLRECVILYLRSLESPPPLHLQDSSRLVSSIDKAYEMLGNYNKNYLRKAGELTLAEQPGEDVSVIHARELLMNITTIGVRSGEISSEDAKELSTTFAMVLFPEDFGDHLDKDLSARPVN